MGCNNGICNSEAVFCSNWYLLNYRCPLHCPNVEKLKIFDDEIINLMDFNCEQRDNVHFFYTLPFEKDWALVETTWLSKMNDDSDDEN